MLPKGTSIFVSCHPGDEHAVQPVLEQVRAAGWEHIVRAVEPIERAAVSGLVQQCGMFVVFLSKAYARGDRLMLEEFAYAAVILRKPFLPVWLDTLPDIRQDCATAPAGLNGEEAEEKRQLLSALEMLTAKHSGTVPGQLAGALAQFIPDMPPYTPSTPQICEKPCEAYEKNEPYLFISYAHDDAERVYPIIKKLFETGWELWYDEGIKTTERYLPVISDHVKRSAVFVLMLTNRCLERPFVMNYEIEYARQLHLPIVPVLLEPLTVPDYVKKSVEPLLKGALAPEALPNRIAAFQQLRNVGTRTAVPPAIKHNRVYDVALPPELPGFEYITSVDEIIITKYVGDETELVIPGLVSTPDKSMIFRVTGIERCFPDSIEKVILPDTITRIGDYAFSHCKLLTGITIPDSVTSIGECAFWGCTSLTGITIPEGIIY